MASYTFRRLKLIIALTHYDQTKDNQMRLLRGPLLFVPTEYLLLPITPSHTFETTDEFFIA